MVRPPNDLSNPIMLMNWLPKIIFTDIDGVWTDGGMYYDQQGNELKKFNTYDSAGILYARELNIPVVIITGENTAIVERRALKLKVNYVLQGVKNKLEMARDLCDKLKISLSETAFIGDDINDVPLMKAVGFRACPANAPIKIKSMVDFVTLTKGGDGAFREFVEHILEANDLLSVTFEKIIARQEQPQ
jgi:3-deoxy-D-manno-octulosonate 8-phosphate phosphatase (KDO 8-P phosphatase)